MLQHRLEPVPRLCPIDTPPDRPRKSIRPFPFTDQPLKCHSFAGEEVFCFLLRCGVIQCWWCNMLAKIVHALKTLAVVNHQFAGQPEVLEGQGCIFASTVMLDALLSGKIAVAKRSAQSQLS